MNSTSNKVFGLLLAAGSSTRMGAEQSKIFLEFGGESVLERSIRKLIKSELVSEIIVICREPDLPRAESIAKRHGISAVIKGGASRQESVCCGLAWLKRNRPKELADSFVLVHDAARCLVGEQLVRDCITEAFEFGAATLGIPSVDSLKLVDQQGIITNTIPRAGVFRVQTPQVFRVPLLFEAHNIVVAESDTQARAEVSSSQASKAATDDASLVELLHPVKMVPGSEDNIKITYQEDLLLAQFIAQKEAGE